MDNVEFRLQLFQTRSSLQKKGILKPVKAMISNKLWVRTSQDNNYISGRIINEYFLGSLKQLDSIIE